MSVVENIKQAVGLSTSAFQKEKITVIFVLGGPGVGELVYMEWDQVSC